MEVKLPSGNTAQFRDVLMRGDIREARRGMKFVTGPDGSRVMDGAFIHDLTDRVITIMLVDWSFGPPRPRDCQSQDLAQQLLDRTLDDDDSLAMDLAVAPWVDRIVTAGSARELFTHNATGVRVRPADPADAARLAASPDFTAAEAPGPKNRAITGTSSSENPGPAGPTSTG